MCLLVFALLFFFPAALPEIHEAFCPLPSQYRFAASSFGAAFVVLFLFVTPPSVADFVFSHAPFWELPQWWLMLWWRRILFWGRRHVCRLSTLLNHLPVTIGDLYCYFLLCWFYEYCCSYCCWARWRSWGTLWPCASRPHTRKSRVSIPRIPPTSTFTCTLGFPQNCSSQCDL